MQPEMVDNREAQRFEIVVDGEVGGFVQYKRHHDTLSLIHTEIGDAFEGRGLASTLVRDVLEAARKEGAAVLPFCPFVRSYVQRHPEYVPLVPEGRRAAFGLAEEAGAP